MTRAALTLAMIAAPASAQPNCAPHEMVQARLAAGYGETRQAIAIASNNAVVEIYASDAGTWTITVTAPGGLTCMVAAGIAYEAIDEDLPPPGDEM